MQDTLKDKEVKGWDLFCSYCRGKNTQNVIEIRNQLVKTLNITTWIDVLEMKSGDRAKKIYEGITNSSMFLCFVTPEYSDNKDCINELCLAKNLGKEMIFFINEDTTGMNQEMLTKNILKEVSFYMGDAIYYRKRDELYDAVEKALDKKTKSDITNKRVSAFVSYHNSTDDTANALIKRLEPLVDVHFESKQSEMDKYDAIMNCDAFIACVNSSYLASENMKDEYNYALTSGKVIIMLNFEKDCCLNDTPSEKISSFNLYNDFEMRYVNGQGRIFIELVYFLEKKFPKSLFQNAKQTDVLIITSKDIGQELAKLNLWKNAKFSYPSNALESNLAQVKDAKVVLAIISEEINKCEKSIEELKFAHMLKNQIVTIEDTEIERLNIDLKEIMKSVPSESQFQGIENLSNKKFTRQLGSHVKNAIMRSKMEKDIITTLTEAKNDKLFEEDNRIKVSHFKRQIVSWRVLLIAIGFIILIGYIIAISVGGAAISKIYIEELTSETPSTMPSTPAATPISKRNNCSRSSSSSPNFRKQEYIPFSLYKVNFKGKKVLNMVEICVPLSRFVANLGDALALIDENGIALKKVEINFYLNKKNTSMVATENEIVILDGSDFLYRFSLDLDYIESLNVNKGVSPMKLSSLHYFNRSLYVFEPSMGFLMFNMDYVQQGLLKIKMENQVLFRVNRDFIYMTNSTHFGKYAFAGNSLDFEQILCYNDDESTVGITDFFADSDEFLYWTCSNANDYSLYDYSFFSTYYSDCIYVSKIGALADPYNIIYYYDSSQISQTILDSKGRLVLATYDGENSAIDFLV